MLILPIFNTYISKGWENVLFGSGWQDSWVIFCDSSRIDLHWQTDDSYLPTGNHVGFFTQGRGAQREDMHTTRDHLKEFNAKRKLRGAVHGIMAANELYREAQDKKKETQLLSV